MNPRRPSASARGVSALAWQARRHLPAIGQMGHNFLRPTRGNPAAVAGRAHRGGDAPPVGNAALIILSGKSMKYFPERNRRETGRVERVRRRREISRIAGLPKASSGPK